MVKQRTTLSLSGTILSVFCLGAVILPGETFSNTTSIVYDDFNDDYLSKTRWTSVTTAGTALREVNGNLEMDMSKLAAGNSIVATAVSYCWFTGDFDIETEYDLLSWPYANGVRLGLSVHNVSGSAVMMRASLSSNENLDLPGEPREMYVMDSSPSPNVAGITETSDQNGKLRLQRVGTAVTGYYYESLTWKAAATYSSTSVVGDSVRFRLSIWSHDQILTPNDQNIEVAFDNVIVNEGELVCPVKQVSIDIKPGSDTNSINQSAAGVIPVAILSSESFDAFTVNPDTISLAGARVKMVGKSGRHLCSEEDANNDGLADLVCKVETAQFMIEEGESIAVLEAQSHDGVSIRGEDNVNIVPN